MKTTPLKFSTLRTATHKVELDWNGVRMNIDESLEALTHSVELLAGMQIETEKHIEVLAGM